MTVAARGADNDRVGDAGAVAIASSLEKNTTITLLGMAGAHLYLGTHAAAVCGV